MKSIINKIKPTLPIPGLSSTNIENDSSKNANNNASLPILVLSNFEATVTKYRDNASGRDKTSVSVAKHTATLSPVQATTQCCSWQSWTNKAIGGLGKGTKTLPQGIKMPLQVASLIPVVGNVASAVTLTAETTLTTAAVVNNNSNDFEFEL